MAETAHTLGWTMNEVRAHTITDVAAMLDAIAAERRERERLQRRAKARAESRAMAPR